MYSRQLLQKELKQLVEKPVPDVEVFLENDCLGQVDAKIKGPENTPYEGGEFRVRLEIPADYPTQPPKGYFQTRIFHPNIAPSGDICVNVLKKEWKPDYGLRNVFQVIRCLLIEPNAESALNEEAGRLIMENFVEYQQQAKLLTEVHAIDRSDCLSPVQQSKFANLDQMDSQEKQKLQSLSTNSLLSPSKKRTLFESNVENEIPSQNCGIIEFSSPTKKRKIMTIKSPKTSKNPTVSKSTHRQLKRL
eukprot:TRINITY_DN134_c0_g1_i5.p1 TRINITY_DN134_c0_g1~~TRINITY_DN134_c0_g1_i5.p1  ORF type:complete len:247 (-),score=24.68 TRINITY_DN134_c0_g1_i5:1001-1741(-)